jgi:hypothetical protein
MTPDELRNRLSTIHWTPATDGVSAYSAPFSILLLDGLEANSRTQAEKELIPF